MNEFAMFRYWLRAILNVILRRPTMYKITVLGGTDVLRLPKTAVVTGCIFLGPGTIDLDLDKMNPQIYPKY